MNRIMTTLSLLAAAGLTAGSAHGQTFLAGWDFDVLFNHDADPNTPNIVDTEPGFTSIVATGSKVYNAVSNGITFDFDASGTDGGNANRKRSGSVASFPLITDFIQVRNNNDDNAPPFPEAALTFSGLDANTEYAFIFSNYNAGAFQQEHRYYQGDVATGTLLGDFTPSGNPNDPENWIPSTTFNLFSDGAGVVDVTITRTDGQRITFNGLQIDSLGTGFDPADLDQDGDVDDADFGIAFAAFTGPGGGPSSNPDADLDNDGDVDDADFGIAFAAFTGPGGAAVPEPASLALLGLGVFLIARRRRA